jgi:hypothetical protein
MTPATNPCTQVLDNIITKARQGMQLRSTHAFSNAADPTNTTDFTRYVVGAAGANAVCNAQAAKTDQQSGSTSSGSGSTSLAQKGAVSEILSAAVDNGGLQREVSGTTVTFRGKPLGLLESINKQYDFFSTLAAIETDPAKNFFNRFSFAVAFNTDRGGVQNTLLANGQQLQSWSGRVELVNQRDAHRRQYAALWKGVSDANAFGNGQNEQTVLHAFENWPDFQTWLTGYRTMTESYDDMGVAAFGDSVQQEALLTQFRAAVQQELNQMALKDQPKDLQGALGKVLKGWAKLDADSNKVMAYAQKGQLLTFDWTTQRDPSLPNLFSNTLVYEASPFKGRIDDFTLNVAADWYRVAVKPPAGSGQFKDFNSVAEYDVPLGKVGNIGNFILSFTGKYQYVAASLIDATSLSASQIMQAASSSSSSSAAGASGGSGSGSTPPAISALLPTIKGNLGALQVKLSIPGGKSGIRVPLAFTAGTRSEVFNKPDYRASIGLSFDLDTLLAQGSH